MRKQNNVKQWVKLYFITSFSTGNYNIKHSELNKRMHFLSLIAYYLH